MKIPLIQKPFRYRYFDASVALLAVNAVIFMVSEFIWPELSSRLALFPAAVRSGHAWYTVLTYMFAHGSMMHLFSNMLGLVIFGRILEKTLGSIEFLVFYFFTGIMSGLASYWYYAATGQWYVALIGASGCIYGIMLLFALLYPHSTVYVFGIIPMRAGILVVVYFFVEFFSQWRTDGIAHTTHLFGLLFALAYAVLRLGIDPVRALRKERPADGSAGEQ